MTYARSVAVVSALLSVLRRVFEPPAQRVPKAWIHCPVCGRDLVGPYPVGAIVPGPAGPFVDSPSREELIAKCPVHGHRPYNDPDKRPPFRQRALRRARKD